ncbi:MAG: sigma-70 family RNA polymerase sigma factor [Bacteroidales bacterium]|nr:sigma-70 family RNA polymerase sigma factor [Bacteroidales bacterium]MCF8345255.1 sigma-70 family RNA polymerase sigma factor [Bacteroidales bacterium]MCF8349568.1 sigma-70 family RNA polymerase sigma factor [Bacteroidales bacterium]MCF8375127.1 sigma-70 family RNA polymerase sigma factor [Bacteroidales bacterium]MCF8400034.1 sigma-70 family RNA polymerase sigma factor [Bacteroidales bacterium]
MKSRRSFLNMLSAYQGIIHKVGLLYFRDLAEREDNFQETVFQLWRSYPRLKNTENPSSWIYAVAINTSITQLKRKSRMEYRKDLPDIQDEKDVFEQIARNEETEILLKAIRQLNEIDRSLLLLFLEEKSYKEISVILGMSVSNVGVRINRAKSELKKNLKNT